MYSIGEIDFGISGSLEDYLKRYKRKGRDDILSALSHLACHVEEIFKKQAAAGLLPPECN